MTVKAVWMKIWKILRKGSDIDCFVYEVCKPSEYGQGASSFQVFIATKIKQSCDEEKEYYTKVEMVFLRDK